MSLLALRSFGKDNINSSTSIIWALQLSSLKENYTQKKKKMKLRFLKCTQKIKLLQRHTLEVRRQLQRSDEEHLVTLREFTAIRRCARNPVPTWSPLLIAPLQASLVESGVQFFLFHVKLKMRTGQQLMQTSKGNLVSKIKIGVAALRSWRSWSAFLVLFCLTFNSSWSSKYGLESHYAHWQCNSCAKNLPFSVTAALSGAKAEDLIGRDWNQLWHPLIVYSCCITAAPSCARAAPASVFYPPPM